MRTGRPAFHIKAYWITQDLPSGSFYYELNAKGELIRTNGKVVPQRFVPAKEAPPPVAPAQTPEEWPPPALSPQPSMLAIDEDAFVGYADAELFSESWEFD